MERLGRHLIIELFDCDKKIISDLNTVKELILEAVRISGATIVESFFHLFPPNGVSGIVVVAESHFSIHTWPEYSYAAVDIFTCGDSVDSRKALSLLKEGLKAKNVSMMELERGPTGPARISDTDADVMA